MAALAVFAFSCKPNTPDNPDPGPEPGPGPEPEPEYVAPVKIDGNFDDWAKIDASKLAIATCANVSKTKALKVLKVYMDELYVFFYFEFDDALIPDKSDVQCHFYFNADNDQNTGGYANQFTPGCFEYMCEGHIFRSDAFSDFDPSISEWTGEQGATGWDWEDLYPSGSGIFHGAGGGNAYEVSLMRESFQELGEIFQFGMDIQQEWNSVGILPNAEITDDNMEGKAAPLTVQIK